MFPRSARRKAGKAMAAQPAAEAAQLEDALGRSEADEHPVTLDLDQPCPDDMSGAVVVLWSAMRELRAEVTRLRGQLAGRM